MLSIGKLGHGQADYYLQAVGQGIEDYYTGQGEAPGRWLDNAARELGLGGEVDATALRALLDGNRPDGSALVRSARSDNRVPGFDLTFSAPKSLSLLFGLGDANVSRAVRDAHEAAVDAGFDYMQRHAAMGRRGPGGAISVLGNGFIGAGFRHRTSRAGDPQLHTHVLVANMTRGPDGRWTALDARRLYAHARTGGFLYQAKLRLELTRRLGLEWTPVKNGVAEVDGIPPALRRAFSRRRQEIESELTNRGERSSAAAQIAALHTRREKDYGVPAEALRDAWRDQAQQLGFDPDRLQQLLEQAKVTPLAPPVVEALQEELAGPTGLTERRSSFTRRDVVQAWCERLDHGGEVPDIERLADNLLASEHVVVLAHDAAALTSGDVVRRADGRVVAATSEERRYSTPELLALEHHVLAAAEHGRCTGRGQIEPALASRTLASRPELSDEQREMVRRLISDGDLVSIVVGKAGTGKTYALDAAREVWQADGQLVIGAALARRAALELRDGAGIPSTSIHALIADLRAHPNQLLGPRVVLVVDEAGMVGTRQLAEIVEHVQQANAKLVLVGDPRQLPEIDAGGTFRSLMVRGEPIRLSENRRQQSEWEREALELLRSGRAADAVVLYRDHGQLVLTDTAPNQRERMVEDWWQARQAGSNTIMVALRRSDVAELNHLARARMATAGRLGLETLTVHGLPVAVGDEIVCLRNHAGLGVTNGTQGTVCALDRESRSLAFADRVGREIILAADYLDSTTQRGGPTIAHGYALTGHKAQGVTVDETLVLGSDALYREWGYVAMSRGRLANRLYLVAGQAEFDDPLRRDERRPPLEQTTHALSHGRAQVSATDSTAKAAVDRMTTAQLEQRLEALVSDQRLDDRRLRREQALRERAARRGDPPAPQSAPAASSSSAAAERGFIAEELERRSRASQLVVLTDPPAYLVAELGPVPDAMLEQRRWQQRARDIERLRTSLGYRDSSRALPDRIEDPRLRRDVDRLRAELAGRPEQPARAQAALEHER